MSIDATHDQGAFLRLFQKLRERNFITGWDVSETESTYVITPKFTKHGADAFTVLRRRVMPLYVERDSTSALEFYETMRESTSASFYDNPTMNGQARRFFVECVDFLGLTDDFEGLRALVHLIESVEI